MLTPPPGIQERILAMGGFGSGKTTMWLSIAKLSQDSGSDAMFYVIDTDNSVRHMISVPGSQYEGLTNVILFTAYEFPEYMSSLRSAVAAVRPGLDWVVVDFASAAWDASQEFYVNERYKAGMAEFFLEQAKAANNKAALDGWKDWSVINRIYRDFSNTLLRHEGHVFLTAGAKALGDSEDRSVRATFGAHGVRPTGQKHLGHLPHTVLLNTVVKPGEIFVTTVKDRERAHLEAAQIHNFGVEYLVNIAGWKLA